MKLKLTVGRTINMGNYESARVEVSAEVTEDLLQPNDLAEAMKSNTEHLYREISIQLQRVIDAECTTDRKPAGS